MKIKFLFLIFLISSSLFAQLKFNVDLTANSGKKKFFSTKSYCDNYVSKDGIHANGTTYSYKHDMSYYDGSSYKKPIYAGAKSTGYGFYVYKRAYIQKTCVKDSSLNSNYPWYFIYGTKYKITLYYRTNKSCKNYDSKTYECLDKCPKGTKRNDKGICEDNGVCTDKPPENWIPYPMDKNKECLSYSELSVYQKEKFPKPGGSDICRVCFSSPQTKDTCVYPNYLDTSTGVSLCVPLSPKDNNISKKDCNGTLKNYDNGTSGRMIWNGTKCVVPELTFISCDAYTSEVVGGYASTCDMKTHLFSFSCVKGSLSDDGILIPTKINHSCVLKPTTNLDNTNAELIKPKDLNDTNSSKKNFVLDGSSNNSSSGLSITRTNPDGSPVEDNNTNSSKNNFVLDGSSSDSSSNLSIVRTNLDGSPVEDNNTNSAKNNFVLDGSNSDSSSDLSILRTNPDGSIIKNKESNWSVNLGKSDMNLGEIKTYSSSQKIVTSANLNNDKKAKPAGGSGGNSLTDNLKNVGKKLNKNSDNEANNTKAIIDNSKALDSNTKAINDLNKMMKERNKKIEDSKINFASVGFSSVIDKYSNINLGFQTSDCPTFSPVTFTLKNGDTYTIFSQETINQLPMNIIRKIIVFSFIMSALFLVFRN